MQLVKPREYRACHGMPGCVPCQTGSQPLASCGYKTFCVAMLYPRFAGIGVLHFVEFCPHHEVVKALHTRISEQPPVRFELLTADAVRDCSTKYALQPIWVELAGVREQRGHDARYTGSKVGGVHSSFGKWDESRWNVSRACVADSDPQLIDEPSQAWQV